MLVTASCGGRLLANQFAFPLLSSMLSATRSASHRCVGRLRARKHLDRLSRLLWFGFGCLPPLRVNAVTEKNGLEMAKLSMNQKRPRNGKGILSKRIFLSLRGCLCHKRPKNNRKYYSPQIRTIASAKIFALISSTSISMNSSSPCMWWSTPATSQPKATPPSISCT